jgi:hypothetical protein
MPVVAVAVAVAVAVLFTVMHTDTSPDELFHLESILSRVSQFHVAEKKPAQLPNPDQVTSLCD